MNLTGPFVPLTNENDLLHRHLPPPVLLRVENGNPIPRGLHPSPAYVC